MSLYVNEWLVWKQKFIFLSVRKGNKPVLPN
jgi:hypothetical protein